MSTAKNMRRDLQIQKDVYPFKSAYGSHAAMVDEEGTKKLLEKLSEGHGKVVCQDISGFYITDKNLVDSGIADQNRCCAKEYRDNIIRDVLGEEYVIAKKLDDEKPQRTKR